MARRGGRTRPVRGRKPQRQMARGGRAKQRPAKRFESGGSYNYSNTGCTMLTSEIDCKNTAGCNWDFNSSCCH